MSGEVLEIAFLYSGFFAVCSTYLIRCCRPRIIAKAAEWVGNPLVYLGVVGGEVEAPSETVWVRGKPGGFATHLSRV